MGEPYIEDRIEESGEDRAHERLRLVLVACVGGLVALLVIRFLPLSTHQLGPAEVAVRAQLGPGETILAIPPVGTISAATHAAPLGYEVTLGQVDFTRLAYRIASSNQRAVLAREVEADLRRMAVIVALQLLLGAALVGALAGAILPHRHLRDLLAGAIGGAVTVGLLIGISAATFKVEGFEEPKFTGALVRAPQLIEAVNQRIGSFDELRSRYEVAAERLSELLRVVAEPIENPHAGSVAILHVSDIHSNPIGIEVAQQLAEQFSVDAIVDTGDITSFGAPVEQRIAEPLARLRVPYLFVPGNHDSEINRVALGRIRGVTLLDGEVETVLGVDILGVADPTFTATGEITTEEGNALRAEDGDEVALEVTALQPDVLAVHDQRQAEASYGLVPLVLAGHTHEEDAFVVEDTQVLVVGSTGATGLGSFTVDAEQSYEAEIVYFRAGRAVAYDYVRFEGLLGDFEVERHTLEPIQAAQP